MKFRDDKLKFLKSNKQGFALAVIMLAVVMLALVNVGLLNLGLQNRLTSTKSTLEISARNAADAGLEKAIYEMNAQLEAGTWDDSNLPIAANFALTNSDSEFDYTVTSVAAGTSYEIEVTGRSGRQERKVYSSFRLKWLFDGPILVKETITLGNNVTVDGYNSSDPTDTDVELNIGTLSNESEGGSITIGNGSVIEGDVFVGFEGDPTAVIDNGGTINGSEITLPEDTTLQVVTPPTLTDMGTSINANVDLTIGPSDSGQYTGISVGINKTLSVSGGDVTLYVTGDVDMTNGSVIIVESGASLALYLDGDFDADKADGVTNDTGFPINFKLYGTGPGIQQYTLKNGGEVFGLVYAPNADIIFKNNGDLKGAIIANNFDMKNGGTFYYDEALRDVTVNDEDITFEIRMWREE